VPTNADVSVLIVETEYPADIDHYRSAIAGELPMVQVHGAASSAEAAAWRGDVTAVIGKAQSLPASLLCSLPRLQWIQALTTGVDPLMAMKLPPHITIASARGIHGPQMSELCFMHMLILLRDYPRMARNQAAARWERKPQRLLDGKTIGIVGMGAISVELAARCRAFGMRVIGVSDSLRHAEGFAEIVSRSSLVDVAARVDFLVVLVPYTDATHHIINANVLRAMRSDSYLINIARGAVVDEAALVEVMREQRIAGAGLDVFATEPLPASSPLWTLPNVIITPHIGGLSDNYAVQLTPLLLHNLRCHVNGDITSMRNIVAR
jgi:phosphoglycerate dehydrogenase-like enzyme